MPILTETLYGSRAKENGLVFHEEDEYVFKSEDESKRFSLNEDILSKGLLCIGGTGSGKTNTIDHLVSQIKRRMTDKDVMLIFDTKGDFYDEFYEDGDAVLGNSNQFNTISERWNAFKELTIDGDDDGHTVLNINDLCRCLFKKYESSSQPFFSNAGRGLVAAVMLYIIRYSAGRENPEQYRNNEVLVRWFEQAQAKNFQNLYREYADLSNVGMYLGNGENDQALGVLSEAIVMIKDNFLGVFGENGDFSIRDFIRSKGGRTLFIEYDLSIGEVLSPIYSLLMDLALKEALGRHDAEDQGRVYVVIDEFKLLPYLTHIDDAVNFGRSMGLKVIAGMQSMAQLYDVYGKDKGMSIAAGFSSVMAFRPNDWITAEYLRDAFGVNLLSETALAGSLPSTQRREGHVVEAWELSKLSVGQAFIRLIEAPPFQFRFSEYKGRKCYDKDRH